jgi:hypothetical protein
MPRVFVVADVSPYRETLAELVSKYGTTRKLLSPDAEFENFGDAKEEALRRSFINGWWPVSEVRDTEGALGFALDGRWESELV